MHHRYIDSNAACKGAEPLDRSHEQSVQKAGVQRDSLGDLSQRLLLETYAPASVLINRKQEGLYYFGPTDRYLRTAAGEASRDVIAMAREGLPGKLRAAIRRANQERPNALVTDA